MTAHQHTKELHQGSRVAGWHCLWKRGRVGVILTALFLAGCAANPAVKSGNNYTELYEGASELTFSTLMPVESAEEAIARGDAAYRRGKVDEAVFEYIRSLELDPDNADTFYKIGAINLHKEANNKAASAFRLALEKDASHPGALEGLGLMMMKQREYDQARTMLEQAVEADSNRWQALNALGIMADLRGDFTDARNYYDRALLLAPRNVKLHNNLGYSYYLIGHWDRAESQYQTALGLAPGHERTWRNLGQLYTRLERYDEAQEAFAKVMSEADALNTMGYIRMAEEDYRQAEAFFQKAAKASPSYHVTSNENLEQVRRLIARE
ncbi:tetratricopeptide repeat protein [uncultured Marinobacter sp.]|uniref:tetratricopeptide repeat protein n=1 Tax=uncultured Marinobacter sp. TaxID=187379 RepID=UPI00262BEB7C|nr:tetratricopeptide repeat protein [uncultured Marinobacter sp.]